MILYPIIGLDGEPYNDLYSYVARNRRFLEKSGDIISKNIPFISLNGKTYHSALSRQKEDEAYLQIIENNSRHSR